MTPEAAATTRLYCGFQFFFSLLFWLPVFYEYQKRIGLTDPEIFGIQSLYYIAFCVLEIPTGLIADRLGYRRCLRAGAATLVVANLLPIFDRTHRGFLAHFMLIALARSFISGASSAYLYCYLQRLGAESEYKKIEGNARAYGLIGKVVGWAGIGVLMEWQLTAPYWLTVGAALVSVGYALALPEVAAPEAGPGETPSVLGVLGRTVATLAGTPILVLLILQGVAVFVLGRICQVNLFQPMLDAKGIELSTHGAVMSLMTVFEAIGSARSGWLRSYVDDFRAVSVLTVLLAAALMLVPLAGPWSTAALLCVFAYATGLCFPIQRQLLNDAIRDSRQRATILSVESIVDRAVNAWVAGSIGAFLAAGRLDQYLWLSGATTILIAVLLHPLRRWLLAREARSLAAPAPRPPP